MSRVELSDGRFTAAFVQIQEACGRLPAMSGMRDVEFIEAICQRFMAACEATGLKKKDFAASVGITGPQLTNIRNYRNPPPLKAITEAARVYGLTTDFFYTGN